VYDTRNVLTTRVKELIIDTIDTKIIIITIVNGKEVKNMVYIKPEILAQSTVQMAECRPNSKPSGRPCDKPGPGGR